MSNPESYFDKLKSETEANAVELAANLIEQESVQAKIEQRAFEVELATTKGEAPKVVNHGRTQEERAGAGPVEG